VFRKLDFRRTGAWLKGRRPAKRKGNLSKTTRGTGRCEPRGGKRQPACPLSVYSATEEKGKLMLKQEKKETASWGKKGVKSLGKEKSRIAHRAEAARNSTLEESEGSSAIHSPSDRRNISRKKNTDRDLTQSARGCGKEWRAQQTKNGKGRPGRAREDSKTVSTSKEGKGPDAGGSFVGTTLVETISEGGRAEGKAAKAVKQGEKKNKTLWRQFVKCPENFPSTR